MKKCILLSLFLAALAVCSCFHDDPDPVEPETYEVDYYVLVAHYLDSDKDSYSSIYKNTTEIYKLPGAYAGMSMDFADGHIIAGGYDLTELTPFIWKDGEVVKISGFEDKEGYVFKVRWVGANYFTVGYFKEGESTRGFLTYNDKIVYTADEGTTFLGFDISETGSAYVSGETEGLGTTMWDITPTTGKVNQKVIMDKTTGSTGKHHVISEGNILLSAYTTCTIEEVGEGYTYPRYTGHLWISGNYVRTFEDCGVWCATINDSFWLLGGESCDMKTFSSTAYLWGETVDENVSKTLGDIVGDSSVPLLYSDNQSLYLGVEDDNMLRLLRDGDKACSIPFNPVYDMAVDWSVIRR